MNGMFDTNHSHAATTVLSSLLALGLGTLSPARAQSPEQPDSVIVTRSPQFLQLSLQPGQDGGVNVVLVSLSDTGCLFPQLFELPIQLDGTAFQLKRVLRASQETQASGACVEGLATVYNPADYAPLGTAAAIVLHLPTGEVNLPPEAVAFVHDHAPKNPPAPQVLPPGAFTTAASRLARMLADGDGPQALQIAEALAPLAATRPPAEAINYYSARGSLRKASGDLPGAATCFEIVTRIAAAAGDESVMVGVTYDNLATLRRQTKDLAGATTASDRALAILEKATGSTSRSFGVALHNRAMLALDLGQPDTAYAFEERATPILEAALKNDTRELAAFRKDRQMIEALRSKRR